MAPSSRMRLKDNSLHCHCFLWVSAVLCLTRTAGGVVTDQMSSGFRRAELWKPVSLGAGLSDVTATVGRVFKFMVPDDAFKGDSLQYEIVEAGRDSLPSWVFYNYDTHTLYGIPSEADLDQYYVKVTAVGRSFNSSSAASVTDIFSISVLPERRAPSTAAVPLKDATATSKTGCGDNEAMIEATVILDANWDKMGVEERMKVVSKMSQHSRLGMDVFRLLPAGSKSLLDGSLMVAGPGNVKREKHPGVALSWRIGCSKTNSVDKFPVVTVLETASKDGSMASELKHDIIGWRVTNDRPDRLKRVRRQANLVGTPVPTPMPTVTTPKPTTLRDTTVVLPTTTMTVSRTFSVVEPTPSVVPTMVQPSITIRPTVTASPSKTVSPTPTPSTSAPQPKPTMSPVPSTTPTPTQPTATPTSSSVIQTRSPMPEPTPTPTKPPTPHPPTPHPPTPHPPIIPTSKPPTTTVTTPKPSIATTPHVNTPPEIHRRLKRVEAMEGKLLEFQIPRNTFRDAEDGDTRNLNLVVLTLDHAELGQNFWLKFDRETQTLSGLPLEKQAQIKRYQFVLVAQDSEGLEKENAFEVVVAAQPDLDSAENPPPVKMGMTLDIDYDMFMNDPALQLAFLNKIAMVFGDSNADAITITDIRRGSVIISWVNNTLPVDSCDRELISELLSKFMTEDGKPTQALIDAFLPEFNISGVESFPLGVCASPTTESMTPTQTTEPLATTDDPGAGGQDPPRDMWISTVLPAVIIAGILLIAGIIIFILYRKSRKGKLSDEDQNTFINKGIPIIFADEIEDGEKPPSSSSPLIMKTEKPPLSPPEYTETQQPLITNHEQPGGGEEEDKHSLPMVDMSGTPSYQPPPPLSPSPPENRNNTPSRDISSYRKPPAYVHIQP